MNPKTSRICLVLAVVAVDLACAGIGRRAEYARNPPTDLAALWVDPGEGPRDLFHGPGGADLAPRPGSRFQFISKDTKGFSWGWDVRDESGLEWSVKYGPEAQSEVTASRVLWALGYHQPPTYYVEQWILVGGPELGPKMPARFRPKQPSWRREGNWSFAAHPLRDTAPFHGLLVLMRILNNWDLLDQNNYVYLVDPPIGGARRVYVVQDLGGSLGRTRMVPDSGTRNDIDDFERQGFVDEVKPDGTVDFDGLGRRRHHRKLFRDVTLSDVRWSCERLARLTSAHWDDIFRAAGYDGATARRFIAKIQEKVRAGLTLGEPAGVDGGQALSALPAGARPCKKASVGP